jgi:hypothetical protein
MNVFCTGCGYTPSDPAILIGDKCSFCRSELSDREMICRLLNLVEDLTFLADRRGGHKPALLARQQAEAMDRDELRQKAKDFLKTRERDDE